ncbi:unnamed protein product [Caenorhabditis angaria]|uniref:Cadherin domain-containing protein n=1 Tax=Caenorhabditis angaria TaxID=860376 RepID=A0A9P1IQ37_9PELO|nr:unnamed protein product [Caenorhabditis angaria]
MILILLIWYKSPKKLGSYKYLMLFSSFCSIFLSIMEIVARVNALSFGTSFVAFIDRRDSIFSFEIDKIILCVGCSCCGMIMYTSVIHFIFRLWAIERPSLKSSYGIDPKDVAIIGEYYYSPNKLNFYRNLGGLLVISVTMIISSGIIIYCGVRIFRKIRKIYEKGGAPGTKRLQTQLYKALVVQTILPLFLTIIPVGILNYFPLINIDLGIYSQIPNAIIAIYPIFEPLPALIIIDDYRIGFWNMVLARTNQSNDKETSMRISLFFIFLPSLFLIHCCDCAYLLVEPSFLLVEEDWKVSTSLPVTICPRNVKIISGDPTHYFDVIRINETCATLRLNTALDADKQDGFGGQGQSFSLVIAGPKKSRATLEIQIVDVNDNPPVFYNTISSLEVSESTEVETELFKVYTSDPDTGINGISRFSIDNEYFKVDKKRKCGNGKCSSSITLAKPLSFENKPIHVFNVTARDGDPHTNRTHIVTHTVTVNVKNEQNNPPVFENDFSKTINFKASDEIVVKIRAIDKDFSKVIKYSIEENAYFEIDEKSGEIRIRQIPPENQLISLEVTATEDDSAKLKTSAKINLMLTTTVTQQLCEYPIYEAKLIEGMGEFENPVKIKILGASNQNIRLIGGTESFAIENVNENEIELKISDKVKVASQNLDNAQLLIKSTSSGGQCRITLRSIQKEQLVPKMTPQKIKHSNIKFENDGYILEVVENKEPGEIVGIVRILGSKIDVDYSLSGENAQKFEIDGSSGEIKTKEKLDREEIARYHLTVKAETKDGSSAKMAVTINVLDENDNSPIFEKSEYVITIDEGKADKLQVTAKDSDDSKNGEIVYTILNKPQDLPIDISSEGLIFIGAIDRESLSSKTSDILLTIQAKDKGDPARSSEAKVIIKVRDINDNSPIFDNSRYSIILDANISPGGVFGNIHADDLDATSPNNYVTYSTADNRFKISDNGDIVFVGPGILSKDNYLEFNVTAKDGGIPENTAIAQVVINEHKSGLQNELTTEINSNDTMSKSEIKWLNAGMPGYNYEIVRATANGFDDKEVAKWIEIDRKSGRIHTISRIDPDLVKQIKLYISMRKGKREVPVELIINVVDTDEVIPSYPKNVMKFTTTESVTIGSTIADLHVENVSPKISTEYTLTITKGPKGKLKINPAGRIILEKQLDYEKEQIIEGKVTAKVRGKIASVRFEIKILDANDNRPVFKNGSIFSIYIEESAVLGTLLDLPYPLAVDKDSGNFALLKYSMTGDEGFFKIDASNSTIRLVAPLDYEKQRVHSLSVKCVDNDGKIPHHEVFASITVYVLDVNDNAPIIHNTDLTHLNVGEDATIGTVVTVLLITDADENGKQRLNVDINSTMFRVDDTFRLLVDAPLIGYAGQRLCSTLTVKDSSMKTSSPYCVTVYPAKNTHHNPLVISPKQNSIHYFDENIVYDELLRVKVLEEENAAGNVTFKLDEMFKKDWQMFNIDKDLGILTAKQPFDFEKKTVHEIKILACRSENCASTHLFISVNDRNDNCPMFPKQDVRLTVVENEKGRRQVGRIPAALDSDFHSDNTKVCYTTDTPMFIFDDPTLPILYTNSSFDREHQKQHQITITAYDCHLSCRDPHKTTNGTIVALIDVIDVNDNFPKFTQNIYTTTIVQGQSTGPIMTVTATDLDEEIDGLKYHIRGFIRTPSGTFSTQDSPLSIDELSGEISSNELLKEPSYQFNVVVTDSAGHEDTCSVSISVVTYAQQTELVFDSPFDLIMKSQKIIGEKLSNATGLQAIIDKCRQNSNFSLMLVHFIEEDGTFANVDRAVNLLMTSNSESRKDLRSTFGLREAFSPIPVQSKMPQIIIMAILIFFLVFIIGMCIWCRQRNNYERKLRHISAQASTVHTVTLGRPNQMTKSAVYGDVPIVRHPPPPPPLENLQSTEL